MNQLKLGSKVFSIHHAEGSAHPENYWLEYVGTVSRTSNINKVVEWRKPEEVGLLGHIENASSESRMLKPNSDGFCYYMAELPDMKQYKDGNLYKVPTTILKKHMKSYKSPWEV